jgi:Ribonuclease G/E
MLLHTEVHRVATGVLRSLTLSLLKIIIIRVIHCSQKMSSKSVKLFVEYDHKESQITVIRKLGLIETALQNTSIV